MGEARDLRPGALGLPPRGGCAGHLPTPSGAPRAQEAGGGEAAPSLPGEPRNHPEKSRPPLRSGSWHKRSRFSPQAKGAHRCLGPPRRRTAAWPAAPWPGCWAPASPQPAVPRQPSTPCPGGRPWWWGPPGRGQRGAGGRSRGFAPRRNEARASPARQRAAVVPPERQATSDRKFVSLLRGLVVKTARL